MQVPCVTRETFIGDNERKQWDASLFLSSPPPFSFISPSHQADSLLLTPAAAMLKIDNKVSGMKTDGQFVGRGRCTALSWPDSLEYSR